MALFLTEADVRRVVSMPMALEAVEEAMKELGGGTATNHPRRRHRTGKGLLHVMDAAIPPMGVMGLKAYTTFRGDVNRFHVLLYSAEDGGLLAMIEADWLGRYRTGAASGVATRYLAREDSRRLGVIGAGRQAETQVLAVCEVRPIEEVLVYCRTKERREAFARRVGGNLRAEVREVDSVEEAVREADVVVTATTAREPVLMGNQLKRGAHVNAIGSNSMVKGEIDRRTITRAGVVAVDSLEQARLESSALLDAVQKTPLEWENFTELGTIAAGKHPGRTGPEQITVFLSHGIAAWDVALAKKIFDAAREKGLGQELQGRS